MNNFIDREHRGCYTAHMTINKDLSMEQQAEAVANELSKLKWAGDEQVGYALLNELDACRHGGSRIVTARDVIEKTDITRGVALTIVLEWLYYRHK